MSYGTSVILDLPFADAAARVRASLQEQGFAAGAGLHVTFRTTCGREIQVGYLVLGGGRHPARRVSLGISASSDAGQGTWAGLTADEARQLAAALLLQAAACDAGRPQA